MTIQWKAIVQGVPFCSIVKFYCAVEGDSYL